jgi:DNA repair exonuclease SbcCD nuclease subunit
MPNQLFKKAAVCSDLHVGAKNNSKQHNEDCLNFVDWFIIKAKEQGAETFIFCGDWAHNRRTVEVSSLNYSVTAFEKLSDAFEKCWIIPGNHDNFYREKRDLNSMPYLNKFTNVHVVKDIEIIDEVAFIPWLVGDEWKKLKNIKSRYCFSHLEMGGFLMNAMVEMPDHGGLNVEHLSGPEYVFSGHFHKRQQKGNIIYIGNAFPHNYADAWDDERGMMILEWGSKPEFFSWPDAPKYRVIKLSELIHTPEKYLDNTTSIRVILDVDVSFEEATTVKETLQTVYNPREISLVPMSKDINDTEFEGGIIFESVDQIVINGLTSLDSTTLDKQLLINIYQNL